MGKVAGWVPLSGQWKSKYRARILEYSNDHLLEKELRFRKEIQQVALSAGFWTGSHIVHCVASMGATVPGAVIHISWQLYRAIEANFKVETLLKEIYRRGLQPRKQTGKDVLETAGWAALSIALSSSLDALSTQFFSDSATHSVTQAAGNGATSVMMGQESVAGATADTWHQVAAHPGSLIAEALYTGGSKALPVAFEELAWLASTNSSRIMATAGAGTALLAASAAIKPHSSWTSVKPAHSHPDEGQASAVSQFSVTAWCTRCRDSFEYTPSTCSDARLCTACQIAALREAHDERKVEQKVQKEMQAQAQAHDLQAMHLGRFCDSCLGCICGTRYSCDTCPDFDLCEACYTGIRHPHDFISYRPASDVQADELCHIEWKLSLTEHEAYCDCCGEDILGIRLQCVDCKRADRIFDLCDQCFSEPPLDFSHPEDHAFATVRFAS